MHSSERPHKAQINGVFLHWNNSVKGKWEAAVAKAQHSEHKVKKAKSESSTLPSTKIKPRPRSTFIPLHIQGRTAKQLISASWLDILQTNRVIHAGVLRASVHRALFWQVNPRSYYNTAKSERQTISCASAGWGACLEV